MALALKLLLRHVHRGPDGPGQHLNRPVQGEGGEKPWVLQPLWSPSTQFPRAQSQREVGGVGCDVLSEALHKRGFCFPIQVSWQIVRPPSNETTVRPVCSFTWRLLSF